MDEEKSYIIYLTSSVILAFVFVLLVGCARPGHEKGDTHTIMLGTTCAKNGTVQSPIWFHTTQGPDQVKKEWCVND